MNEQFEDGMALAVGVHRVAAGYTGHGAATGGLQLHSIGKLYPWHIVGTIVDDETRYYGRDLNGRMCTAKYADQRLAIKWALIDKWETEGHMWSKELAFKAWEAACSGQY